MVALGNIQLALMQELGERAATRLRAAEHALRDATDVIGSLAAFCRTQPMPAVAPMDLNRVVDDVVELTALPLRDAALACGVAVEVRVERGAVPPILGNASALRQALTNVVVNAVEAMPDGGVLSLRTWTDAGGVHCSVSDTGVGMTPEVRRRALEPFQTTKGPKTRGLGLAVAHGILTRHRGSLVIDSLKGLGSSVRLSLPPSEIAPTEASRG
jgi:signal transduction histidine kinase